MKMQKKLLISGLVLAVAGVMVGKGFMSSMAASRGDMVVFTANWCASCREVVPLAQEIASQNGLSVTQIDVDGQNAPKQAQSKGLSIPGDGPPQIFLVKGGHSTLIYNGKNYKFGYQEQARATILQKLQRAL